MQDRKKISVSIRRWLLCVVSCACLSACGLGGDFMTVKLLSAGVSATANDLFKRTDVNLKQKNYAAADYLESQMKGFVKKSDLIQMKALEESDHAGITSPLGTGMAEEIGLRFIQLGYDVSLAGVTTRQNESVPSVTASSHKADFTCTGSYLRGRDVVDVHLRVIDNKSGQIVAQFDYALPITREIREKSQTQTRIFRVEPVY